MLCIDFHEENVYPRIVYVHARSYRLQQRRMPIRDRIGDRRSPTVLEKLWPCEFKVRELIVKKREIPRNLILIYGKATKPRFSSLRLFFPSILHCIAFMVLFGVQQCAMCPVSSQQHSSENEACYCSSYRAGNAIAPFVMFIWFKSCHHSFLGSAILN